MPGTTGVEFFQQVQQSHPDTIRVLITAYTDVDTIIDAINTGHVYRYISKPWTESEIEQTVHNAYEIFHTREQLKSKVIELERANEELNRFIYSASHDLRAPLMSILGIVRLAELDLLDNHMRELFGMIEKSVHRLDDFIQRIITYYQNTRELFERNQIDFEALLQDIWVNLAHYEGAEKMHLEMDIREGAKAFYTDQFRLRIILGNLLSNAIKYQRKEEKAPRVKCLVRASEEEVLIQVSDNGIGTN